MRGDGERLARGGAVLAVHLWVLEGALRKWVPGVDALFYVLRDVVVVLIIAVLMLSSARAARRSGLLWAIGIALGLLGIVHVIGALASPAVALAGLRGYLAPLLMLGLLWAYGSERTLASVLRVIVLYVPLQAAIAVVQVVSPPRSWINREVVEDAASFVNGDVVRVTGTFSAPIGMTLFLTLAAAAVLSAAMRSSVARLSCICLVVLTVGISGARGAVVAVAVVFAAWLWKLAATRGAAVVKPLLGLAVLLGATAWVISAAFPGVVRSFLDRFATAAGEEDVVRRIVGQTLGFVAYVPSWIGEGMGVHSQVGISLGSGAEWIETDSIRWVAELGLVGLLFAMARLILGLWLVGVVAVRARHVSMTFVTFVAALAPVLLSGPVTQSPTTQGFAGICAGVVALASASARRDSSVSATGPARRRTVDV
ncbi:hypothetical protein N8K70_12820 [Microbacterium betulae]|uniref:O-antigen ligase domain-containing protein n=1 Tax=Microbacterium betulae TaxID=2981139 RepID=A0AA97I6A0_9MICO|nr:hypothetical protein [Microbacterium sp. AB]WOF22260.1 hypothetical protein N8K70_12820 [Microbacterium sp. AB]